MKAFLRPHVIAPFLLFLFVVGVCVATVIVLPGCGTNCKDPANANSAECTVINSIIDCTGISSLATAVTELEPKFIAVVKTAKNADGTINWGGIATQLEQFVIQYGACAVAEVFNHFVHPATQVAPNAPAPLIAVDDAKTQFNVLRAKMFPGIQVKLSGGGAL